MSLYVFKDPERTILHTTAHEQDPNIEKSPPYFCPNPTCEARMVYHRGRNGFGSGHFAALPTFPHSVGCVYGSSTLSSFCADEYDMSNFDFSKFAQNALHPGPKKDADGARGTGGTGKKILPTLNNLRLLYGACKSCPPNYQLGRTSVENIILDNRTICNYPTGLSGIRIVEAYPNNILYSSKMRKFYLIVRCSSTERMMYLTVSVPDMNLFIKLLDKFSVYFHDQTLKKTMPIVILGNWTRMSNVLSRTTLEHEKNLFLVK